MINNEEIRAGYNNFIAEIKSKIGNSNNKQIELQVDSDKELLIVEFDHESNPQLNITSFILDEELYRQALGFQVFREDPLLSKFTEINNIREKTTSNFNLKIYKIDDNNIYAKFLINCSHGHSERTIRTNTEELFEYLKGLVDNEHFSSIYNSTFAHFQEYLSTKSNATSITEPSYSVAFTNEQKQAYTNLVNNSTSQLERHINTTMASEPLGEHYTANKLLDIHLKYTDLGRFNIFPVIEYKRSFGDISYTKDRPLILISQSYDLYSSIEKTVEEYPEYANSYSYHINFIDDSPEFRFITRSINKDYKIGDGNQQYHEDLRNPSARYVINSWDLENVEQFKRYLELMINNPRYKAEYDIEFGHHHKNDTSKAINSTDQTLREKYFNTIQSMINITKPGLEKGIDDSIKEQMKNNHEITGANIKFSAEEHSWRWHAIKLSIGNKSYNIIPNKDTEGNYWYKEKHSFADERHYTLAIDDSTFDFLYHCIKKDQSETLSSFRSISKVTSYLEELIDQPLCKARYEIYKKEYEEPTIDLHRATDKEAIASTIEKIAIANKYLSGDSASFDNTYLPVNRNNGTRNLPALPDHSSDGMTASLIVGSAISMMFIIPIMIMLAVRWYRGCDANNHRTRGHADGRDKVSRILGQAKHIKPVDVESPATHLIDVDIDEARGRATTEL